MLIESHTDHHTGLLNTTLPAANSKINNSSYTQHERPVRRNIGRVQAQKGKNTIEFGTIPVSSANYTMRRCAIKRFTRGFATFFEIARRQHGGQNFSILLLGIGMLAVC